MAERLVDEIFAALDEQTGVVPGTEATALIVPSLASSLTAVLDQRKLLAGRIEALLEAHPRRQHLPHRRPPRRLRRSRPATRSSGSSIRGEQPCRRGNKQLKRAFFLSAFAAALLCLARRRADVLFAMLRDGTFYEPQPARSG